MIINVDKENLLKTINIAESAISSKNINTILANCLFKISSNNIEILSTDNEIAIRSKIDGVSDTEGEFTANGKKFSSILKELPNDEVTIKIDDSYSIDIKSKSKNVKGHYKLIGMGSEDYPEIKKMDETNSIEIDQLILKEMFKKVIYAASNDTIKPVFNGLYLVNDSENNITAVATDSRRLGIIKRKISNEINLDDGIIIPLKTVNEVFRLLDSEDKCYFSIENNQCFFKIGNNEIISRIIEGQFPNYKQVIPKEFTHETIIDKKKLRESMRRAMIFTREPAFKVVLTFENDKLIIEANTPDLGEAEEEINIESNNGDKLVIGINGQFMLDALKEISSEKIVCRLTGNMSPVTISPQDDEDYISVIMPIQIKNRED